MRKNLNNRSVIVAKHATGFVAAFSMVLLMAGCKEKANAPAAVEAPNDVLPAMVSDAMLPLDTVKSQAPFAPSTASARDGGKGAPTATASQDAGGEATPAKSEAENAAASSQSGTSLEVSE